MSWRKWKLGLVVAFIIGFFTACAGASVLDVVLNFKFVMFFLGLIGKDLILFLINHPVDQITFDTQTFSKQQTNENKTNTPIGTNGIDPVK
jgi:hypothetical protein